MLQFRFAEDMWGNPVTDRINRNWDGIITTFQEENTEYWNQYQAWLADGHTTLQTNEPWLEEDSNAEPD